MRRSDECLTAPFPLRERASMRDSHAKGVKIYHFHGGQTRFSGVFEAKLRWHRPCLGKSSACGWSANPSTPSNMYNDPAASGKLRSMLTSGAFVLSWVGRRDLSGSRVGGRVAGVPGCLPSANPLHSPLFGSGELQLFWRAARHHVVFLLLYLTGVMVLDNRHGLP